MAGPKTTKGMAAPAPSPVYILRGANSPVTALEFSALERGTLLSGSQNGRVHLWDLAARRSRCSFEAHDGQSVLCVTSLGSDALLTHGRDARCKVWKCAQSQFVLEGQLTADGDGFCSAVVFPPGPSHLVALPAPHSTIQLCDVNTRSCVRTLSPPSSSAHAGMCMCMCVVHNPTRTGSKLVAGFENGKLIMWDVGTGKVEHESSVHADAVMCVAYSSRLNKGLAGSVSEQLVAWTVSDAGRIDVVREVECTNAGFNAVTIRSDDRIVATAGWDKLVRVFNMKSLRPLAVLPYHRDSVRCVQFSPDNMLAVGSSDHLITMWDVYSKV